MTKEQIMKLSNHYEVFKAMKQYPEIIDEDICKKFDDLRKFEYEAKNLPKNTHYDPFIEREFI